MPLIALPMISSDLPLAYMFAVSIKFTPKSTALFMILVAVVSLTVEPKYAVPKQISETLTPHFPRRLYFNNIH
jgi:hypothetical protein